MERLLVNLDDLASVVSLSPRTLRSFMAKGMPCIRAGRRVLFDPLRVKEWLERGGAAPGGAGRDVGEQGGLSDAAVHRRPTGRPRRVVL